MSGIIKTIKAKDEHDVQHNIYPKTVLEAVVDPDTGKTLDVLLDENMPEGVVYTNDESEPETNVDAVTSASYVSYSNTTSNLEATNVQDAVDELKESVGEYIAENLIAYPYFNTTSTVNGVAFTDNGDGTVAANGTATGSFSGFTCRLYNETLTGRQLTLSKGTYTLSGCPSRGSGGTYFLQVGRTDPTTGSWQTIAIDTGEGATFTITADVQVSVTIAVIGGTTVNNLIFKPMLEVGTVAHEYKPYSLNRLTKGDIVDNCLSNRVDLPLSANMGRDINERLNAHSERFEVLYEHDTFSVVKMGKIIRFYGEITLEEQKNAWEWVADFTAIVQEYKPRVKRYFRDITQQYVFELTEHGFIQTTQVTPAGTYFLDVAWLAQ